MKTTQVTIEDLSSPLPAREGESALAMAKTSLPTTKPAISDLGAVSLDTVAAKKDTSVEKSDKKTAASKTKKATKRQDEEFFDPLTGLAVQETVNNDTADLDIDRIKQTLQDEKQRLQVLADLPLDKDNFVPNLLAILDGLISDDHSYQSVAASLDEIFAGINDAQIKKLESEWRGIVADVQRLRLELGHHVADLLESFATGNNWYRMLAAWEVLGRHDYQQVIGFADWQKQLADLALELLGADQRREVKADIAAGIDAEDSLKAVLDDLQKGGLRLSEQQQKLFLTSLVPIVTDLSDKQVTTDTERPPTQQTDKHETLDEVEPVASSLQSVPMMIAANHEYVDSRCDSIDTRLDELQRSLHRLTDPQQTRLDSMSRDLTIAAQTIDTLTHDLSLTTQRLVKLEQTTASGIRQLGETSISSFTKIADQLESKLEKEKQTSSTRAQGLRDQLTKLHQEVRDQLGKNSQDFKLKITALDEAVSTFKKLQTSKDQDQNKKLTTLRDQFEAIAKSASKQVETADTNLSKARRDFEERFHQLSRQLTDIKTDQTRIDQVQTTALAQLTSQAQVVKTQLVTIDERLEKVETLVHEFDAFKVRVDEQLKNQADRLKSELETSHLRLDKIGSQVADLQAYASRLETENEELRIHNAGLKQENWQAKRLLDQANIDPNLIAVPANASTPVTNADSAVGASINATPETATTSIPTPEVIVPAPAPAMTEPVVTDPVPVVSELTVTTAETAPAALAEESAPAPRPSSLSLLGITHSRLTPGSRLLTGQQLDFLQIGQQLQTALVGLNSFSAQLHAQPSVAQTSSMPPTDTAPLVQSTPISGPTTLVTPPTGDEQPAIGSAPPMPVRLPDLNPVSAIPASQPVAVNSSADQTAIPVPPAPEPGVMVLNPHLPVGDTFSSPQPRQAREEETVVLPFMG